MKKFVILFPLVFLTGCGSLDNFTKSEMKVWEEKENGKIVMQTRGIIQGTAEKTESGLKVSFDSKKSNVFRDIMNFLLMKGADTNINTGN